MNDQDAFNREIGEALYDEHGVPREPDTYPDTAEARAFMDEWAEAEALEVDPSTLHLLESGNLEL